MIKISRGFKIEDLEEMTPHLVFPGGGVEDQAEKYMAQLEVFLKTTPESVVVITARKDQELVGFIVAHNTKDFAYVSQAWSKPGNAWAVSDEMFIRVQLWAIALGKTSIRAETERETSSFFRRFGFEERSVTIEKKIDQMTFDQLLARAREVLSG